MTPRPSWRSTPPANICTWAPRRSPVTVGHPWPRTRWEPAGGTAEVAAEAANRHGEAIALALGVGGDGGTAETGGTRGVLGATPFCVPPPAPRPTEPSCSWATSASPRGWAVDGGAWGGDGGDAEGNASAAPEGVATPRASRLAPPLVTARSVSSTGPAAATAGKPGPGLRWEVEMGATPGQWPPVRP